MIILIILGVLLYLVVGILVASKLISGRPAPGDSVLGIVIAWPVVAIMLVALRLEDLCRFLVKKLNEIQYKEKE